MRSDLCFIKLLLVEDNILNQKLIYLTLSKLGFSIEIANNGEEAILKCSEKDYDVVLMDLMMPLMDGFAATKEIRKMDDFKKNHTYIVGLTANTFDGDRQRCLDVGMDEYMSKPFDIKQFKIILEKFNLIKEF